MGPRIVNFVAWRAHVMNVLRQQLETSGDSFIKFLLTEVADYPVPTGAEDSDAFREADCLVTPLMISTRFGVLSFLNTVTVFGTPNDVTLAELALELLFPASEETIAIVNRMVRETDSAAQHELIA
jgi:hypothetical protein